jgi:hypothetical protein
MLKSLSIGSYLFLPYTVHRIASIQFRRIWKWTVNQIKGSEVVKRIASKQEVKIHGKAGESGWQIVLK